jgi:hypothetical protein
MRPSGLCKPDKRRVEPVSASCWGWVEALAGQEGSPQSVFKRIQLPACCIEYIVSSCSPCFASETSRSSSQTRSEGLAWRLSLARSPFPSWHPACPTWIEMTSLMILEVLTGLWGCRLKAVYRENSCNNIDEQSALSIVTTCKRTWVLCCEFGDCVPARSNAELDKACELEGNRKDLAAKGERSRQIAKVEPIPQSYYTHTRSMVNG